MTEVKPEERHSIINSTHNLGSSKYKITISAACNFWCISKNSRRPFRSVKQYTAIDIGVEQANLLQFSD